jgi:hypothetical protein
MRLGLILQLVVLLAVANGTPVIVNKLLGRRWSFPLDGGASFVDGQPVLGASKTLRGILFAVLVTAASAPLLLGLEWKVGVAIGGGAMAGDLFSSFLKRRMRLPASSRAIGLDQVPESLFPLLACRSALSLTISDIAVIVISFFISEILISRVLYKFRLRDRPY